MHDFKTKKEYMWSVHIQSKVVLKERESLKKLLDMKSPLALVSFPSPTHIQPHTYTNFLQ
jgi:hypothetical protein